MSSSKLVCDEILEDEFVHGEHETDEVMEASATESSSESEDEVPGADSGVPVRFMDPPASPEPEDEEVDDILKLNVAMVAPRTRIQRPEVTATAQSTGTTAASREMGPYANASAPVADARRVYGYGALPRGDPRAVTSTQHASLRYGHVPGMLMCHDLPYFSTHPERVGLTVGDVVLIQEAYPYVRRYARPARGFDVREMFAIAGLSRRGYSRPMETNKEEYALHPLALTELINADWRLKSIVSGSHSPPVAPHVTADADIDTGMHDATDPRLHIAPMFMPLVQNVVKASRQKFLPVQRGMLQAQEELARHIIHCQSLLLHASTQAKVQNRRPSDQPALGAVIDTMMQQIMAASVEMLHLVVYAHRMAYVKNCRPWLRSDVLSQPIFNRRRLFEIPERAQREMTSYSFEPVRQE